MESQRFENAQQRLLDRYGIVAESRFVDAPIIGGTAHVLVSGSGPPVVMLNGIGTPAAMWAPLMAELRGFALHAIDLPGYGLTDTTDAVADDIRQTATMFLEQVLGGLGLGGSLFVANSLGSRWAMWLAADRPHSVRAMVHIGCPALALGTSAPLPMRILSVPRLARILMRIRPPSPQQIERLSKMVHEHPLVPEVADLLLETERLPGFERTFLATLSRFLRLRGAQPDMALTQERLPETEQPTLFIWGSDDPFGSVEVAGRTAAAVDNSQLHIVAGGHAPWLNEAAGIASLVTPFLDRYGSDRG